MSAAKHKPRIDDAWATAFLDENVGPEGWVHDPVADVWVTTDPKYTGPGRAFWCYWRDGTSSHLVAEVIQ